MCQKSAVAQPHRLPYQIAYFSTQNLTLYQTRQQSILTSLYLASHPPPPNPRTTHSRSAYYVPRYTCLNRTNLSTVPALHASIRVTCPKIDTSLCVQILLSYAFRHSFLTTRFFPHNLSQDPPSAGPYAVYSNLARISEIFTKPPSIGPTLDVLSFAMPSAQQQPPLATVRNNTAL